MPEAPHGERRLHTPEACNGRSIKWPCDSSSRPLSLTRLHLQLAPSTFPANSPRPHAGPGRHIRGRKRESMSVIANDRTVDTRSAATPWYGQLYSQVLIGIALGILVGYVWPDIRVALKQLRGG